MTCWTYMTLESSWSKSIWSKGQHGVIFVKGRSYWSDQKPEYGAGYREYDHWACQLIYVSMPDIVNDRVDSFNLSRGQSITKSAGCWLLINCHTSQVSQCHGCWFGFDGLICNRYQQPDQKTAQKSLVATNQCRHKVLQLGKSSMSFGTRLSLLFQSLGQTIDSMH